MRIIWFLIFIFSLILTVVIVEVPTMLFLLFVYALGISISIVFGGKERERIAKVYHSIFTVGSLYMLMTFLYMSLNNYKFLLSYDSYYYFLPTTERYMERGSNYWDTLYAVWENYDFFNSFQSGYFTYSTLFGYLSNFFGANFYIGQQISVLFLFSFVGVVIYKLFRVNSFSNKASKYTLIVCLFSILFFYSSQVLRDIHILLLYLLGIYFTFKKEFSVITLIKLIIVIYLSTTLRLETGLFMVILIPIYLVLTLQYSKYKIIVISFTGVIGLGTIALSMTYIGQVGSVVEATQDTYMNDKGSGVVGTLQKIPLAGDIVSIIYNAAQPIPFWSRFSTTSVQIDDQAVYNIMNFPRSYASFFNWMVIVYIAFWVFSKDIRNKTKRFISKPLLYQLWIGLLFLILQSAVISQRRLMVYYVVFYILFFIIFNNMEVNKRTQISIFVVISFLFLQIIGIFYLV